MGTHTPVEVWVDVGDVVGGVAVIEGRVMQVRCGCTDSLANDWEHEKGGKTWA